MEEKASRSGELLQQLKEIKNKLFLRDIKYWCGCQRGLGGEVVVKEIIDNANPVALTKISFDTEEEYRISLLILFDMFVFKYLILVTFSYFTCHMKKNRFNTMFLK